MNYIVRFGAILACGLWIASVSTPLASGGATATGVSRDFNPGISVNALLLYRSGPSESMTEHDHEVEESHDHGSGGDGFDIQEAELQITSIIDPYAKSNLVFAMHGASGFELEEGFVRFLSLPRGLGLRAGKFYFDFGKHNAYHTHQFPFVEKPYAWETVLAGHGLNGAVIEASWLTPLPWYTDLIAYGFPLIETVYGDHEIPQNKWGGGAKLRQLWDVSDQATFDLGLSWAAGELDGAGEHHEEEWDDAMRHFFGVDLTWKWIGTGQYPKSFEVQSEWLRRLDDGNEKSAETDGFYIHALTRLSRRIHLGARFDLYSPDDVLTTTASFAFVPSEFQAVRLDLVHRDFGEDDDQAIRLQYNFTIGSHPAHRY